MKKKILLCILDGWGLGRNHSKNAIHLAKKKNFDYFLERFGSIKLNASEKNVGLPTGQFGNSEVGHMNIGSGRIILQDILRISRSFENGEIKKKPLLKNLINNCKRLHLLGLLSDGGVHGHQDHLFQLLEIFNEKSPKIFIHCILDGRDSSPISGMENIKLLLEKIEGKKNIEIASISGRFFAMDRDNRWERIEKAYRAIVEGSAKKKQDHLLAIKESYSKHVTDEFFEPVNFGNYKGAVDGDGFFITNYRADRVREILTATFDDEFEYFKRKSKPVFYEPTSMVEYSKRLRRKIKPIFENIEIKNTLGEIVSDNNLKQLRIAETEKYAHVTYFFNGGTEEKFVGEDRILIPSPRVETYDRKPEMAAFEVRDQIINKLKKRKYDLVVANFANPDMVGHTGNVKATVKAVEVVDNCIGTIYPECLKNEYSLIITSDHGNADNMFDKNKELPCTTHSINPVPFIICEKVEYKQQIGNLADIAPTILKMLNIEIPKEMNGISLIK
ncbi:MAG: 2,3-bisphosphoglycerate-independent phosphoglycerate mutase [Pseudomonadota bacterium]|nr:2,3-bisphosphoglycerate-independent phosphoglycerate mutase [Pseudomonadota bacterium]